MRPFKHSAVVAGRDLDSVAEFQAARLNASDGLIGCHPQFRRWPSRLSQEGRFARAAVRTNSR